MHRRLLVTAGALAATLALVGCENTGEGLQEDLEENTDQLEQGEEGEGED